MNFLLIIDTATGTVPLIVKRVMRCRDSKVGIIAYVKSEATSRKKRPQRTAMLSPPHTPWQCSLNFKTGGWQRFKCVERCYRCGGTMQSLCILGL